MCCKHKSCDRGVCATLTPGINWTFPALLREIQHFLSTLWSSSIPLLSAGRWPCVCRDTLLWVSAPCIPNLHSGTAGSAQNYVRQSWGRDVEPPSSPAWSVTLVLNLNLCLQDAKGKRQAVILSSKTFHVYSGVRQSGFSFPYGEFRALVGDVHICESFVNKWAVLRGTLPWLLTLLGLFLAAKFHRIIRSGMGIVWERWGHWEMF